MSCSLFLRLFSLSFLGKYSNHESATIRWLDRTKEQWRENLGSEEEYCPLGIVLPISNGNPDKRIFKVLPILEARGLDSFRMLVTRDESRFVLEYQYSTK
jgi:hypothetical protein